MHDNPGSPSVFSIQHCCTQDGPGLRSVVFVKGCPLRCKWCQNPESWNPLPENGFKKEKCTGCGECVKSCSNGAMLRPGLRISEKCSGCGICSDICPSLALVRFGRYISPAELVSDLYPEFSFFKGTGGGVTFSGGEAGLYPDFISETAEILKSHCIGTAMETCGIWACKKDSASFYRLISSLDLILFDIKLFDDYKHRQFCGSSNVAIKDRLAFLAHLRDIDAGPAIWPRMPLVPGVTDNEDNIRGWADFLLTCGLTAMSIVPYHDLGVSKIRWLNSLENLSDQKFIEPDEYLINKAAGIFESYGIKTFLPGLEKYWDI